MTIPIIPACLVCICLGILLSGLNNLLAERRLTVYGQAIIILYMLIDTVSFCLLKEGSVWMLIINNILAWFIVKYFLALIDKYNPK